MLLRRLLPTALALALLTCAAPAAAAPAGLGTWDRSQQRDVVDAGLMTALDDGLFHGERPLTGAQLTQALTALATLMAPEPVEPELPGGPPADGAPAPEPAPPLAPPPVPVPVATPASGRVSVTAFDRAVVAQLGLLDVAAVVQAQARGAGLNPPAYFGTEVVARQLGLRFNHPAPHDDRELYPSDPITRAEAAWSLAQVQRFSEWEVDGARATLARLAIPALTVSQRRVLRVAVGRIGMPYVWGGETDGRSGTWGRQAHGGYDCSGFAWRVYKAPGFPAGRKIRGRTAAQQAGEIKRSARIHLESVRPGDLLFFGPARFDSRATERGIDHMGIALSPDFMIHSSGQGVALTPLFDDWRRDRFAWARRVL